MALRIRSKRVAKVLLAGALAALVVGVGVESASPAPQATLGPQAAPKPKLGPGSAGIPSKLRKLPNLPSITIDNGVAVFKKRPKSENRTGITKNSILLGQHTALSGPLAYLGIGFSNGANAIFKQVNQSGGIFGRKIRLLLRDDHFDPATTVPVVRQLVESDRVFAVFNALGSSPHKAVFQYLIDKNVPDLFPGVGDGYVGYPTKRTVFSGYLNTSVDVASVAAAACQHARNSKLAVIYQDDAAGAAGLNGVKVAVAKYRGAGCALASSVGFSPSTSDLTPFVAQAVQGKGATDLVVVAFTPQQAGPIVKILRDSLGSKIPVYLTAGAAQAATAQLAGGNNLDGAVSDTFYKNISVNAPVIKQLTEYFTKLHLTINNNNIVGAMWALHMVHALQLAGPDLTRQGLLKAMEVGFNGKWTCAVCPGPTRYSRTDHWTIKSLQLVRWSSASQRFVLIGKPLNFTAAEINQIVGG